MASEPCPSCVDISKRNSNLDVKENYEMFPWISEVKSSFITIGKFMRNLKNSIEDVGISDEV